MRRGIIAAALLAVGCVQSSAIQCPDGTICPEDTTCQTAAGGEWCVTPDQQRACAGMADGTACSFSGATGTCFDGICLPAACANGRVDNGEQCDDGNTDDADGCSRDCRSNESCGNGIIDAAHSEQCDDRNSVSHDGCSSACRVETPLWEALEAGTPSPRFGAAMTYDSDRDRVLLFGGAGSSASYNDLWQWNGSGWSLIPSIISPPPRQDSAFAYDASAHVAVMFGGTGALNVTFTGGPSAAPPSGGEYGDTWVWDGASWTFAAPQDTPTPSRGARMVYDPARGRIVLYGGSSSTGVIAQWFDTTWEWTGTTWKMICDVCPPGELAHQAMAYDPVRGVIVMFGGETSGPFSTKTWELVGDVWQDKTPTASPTARINAVMAFDSVLRKIVMSGGSDFSGNDLGDTWAWDGSSWQDLRAVPTNPFGAGAAASDPDRGRVITFGGQGTAGISGSTGVWDGTTWSKPNPVFGTGALNLAAATDPVRGRTVVWGGRLDAVTLESRTLEFDGEHWFNIATTPPPVRELHAMTYDPDAQVVVMFGGRDPVSNAVVGDTWVYSNATWTRASTTGPARDSHGMAFDGTRVIVFGGETPGLKGDTWAWNGSSWTQLSPAVSPPARTAHGMAYDPIRKRVVVFGGLGQAGLFDDTWEWDGTNWQPIAVSTHPPARYAGAMTWDPVRRRIVLFDGNGANSPVDDVWEYDGATWTQLLIAVRPPPRGGHVLFSTPNGLMAYGGGPVGDVRLWRLRYGSFEHPESCSSSLDLDGDGLAGCADGDCWSICTPLCPPGTSCAADAPRCGDGVALATETCRTCAADRHACDLCGDLLCDGSETLQSCPGDCK